MDIKKNNGIPEFTIENFFPDKSDFVIMKLEDLQKKYSVEHTLPHRISFYKLMLIMKGEIEFWIDSNKYKCHSKSLVSISKGQVESYKPYNSEKGFVLFFSDEYINKYPGDFEWLNGLSVFNPSPGNMLLKLSESEYKDLVGLFKKISQEFYSESEFAKDELIINMIKTILLLAERNKRLNLNKHSFSSTDLIYITEFQKKIGEYSCNSKNVSYFADLLNITPKKLNRITKSILGKPAKRLIEERILLESKRLLVHTDHSMKEIGHTLGFNDPTNFNKFFKKFTQITPAEFRISHQ
jgi:AraC family transcriptional regulator, transcriptional activator of pobA